MNDRKTKYLVVGIGILSENRHQGLECGKLLAEKAEQFKYLGMVFTDANSYTDY